MDLVNRIVRHALLTLTATAVVVGGAATAAWSWGSEPTGHLALRLVLLVGLPVGALIGLAATMHRGAARREAELRRRLEAGAAAAEASTAALSSLARELRGGLVSIRDAAALLASNPITSGTPGADQLISALRDYAGDQLRTLDDVITAIDLQDGIIGIEIETQAVDLAMLAWEATERARSGGRSAEVRGGPVLADTHPQWATQIIRRAVDDAIQRTCRRIEIVVWAMEGQALCEIMDDGLPLSEEAVRRLSPAEEPPQQLLQIGDGRGLAIAGRLARRLGGSLSSSHDEGWTIMTLRLPAAAVSSSDLDPSSEGRADDRHAVEPDAPEGHALLETADE